MSQAGNHVAGNARIGETCAHVSSQADGIEGRLDPEDYPGRNEGVFEACAIGVLLEQEETPAFGLFDRSHDPGDIESRSPGVVSIHEYESSRSNLGAEIGEQRVEVAFWIPRSHCSRLSSYLTLKVEIGIERHTSAIGGEFQDFHPLSRDNVRYVNLSLRPYGRASQAPLLSRGSAGTWAP